MCTYLNIIKLNGSLREKYPNYKYDAITLNT